MSTHPMESASKCDRCGEVVADIDAGFSPGLHQMSHECGGTWQRVLWDRETGQSRVPGRQPRHLPRSHQ